MCSQKLQDDVLNYSSCLSQAFGMSDEDTSQGLGSGWPEC